MTPELDEYLRTGPKRQLTDNEYMAKHLRELADQCERGGVVEFQYSEDHDLDPVYAHWGAEMIGFRCHGYVATLRIKVMFDSCPTHNRGTPCAPSNS